MKGEGEKDREQNKKNKCCAGYKSDFAHFFNLFTISTEFPLQT